MPDDDDNSPNNDDDPLSKDNADRDDPLPMNGEQGHHRRAAMSAYPYVCPPSLSSPPPSLSPPFPVTLSVPLSVPLSYNILSSQVTSML